VAERFHPIVQPFSWADEAVVSNYQAVMKSAPDGAFVRHADYEQLELRATRDRALATRMRDALAKLQSELEALADSKPLTSDPSRMCTPTSGPKLSCGCVRCHEARKRS
jgi:hypothetical protein